MSKQHNDQDDQQTPTGEAKDGAAASSSAQTAGAAKKGGSSTRRSRRHSKPSQRSDSQGDSQASSATASAPGAEGKPASDKPASNTPVTASGTASDSASGAAASSKPAEARKPAIASGTTKAATSDQPSKPAASAAKPAAAKPETIKSEATKPASAAPGAGGGASGGGGSSSSSSQSSGGGKTGAVALALALVVGVGGGYFGWQLWQKLEAHEQTIAALPEAPASQSALDTLESQLQSGEQQRDQAMGSAIDELRGEFSDYRSSVDGTLDKVLTQLSQAQDTDERDWLHAEAAYLLRLANQRLQLERDVGGAAALLRTADERLLEADNPALVPVRREIASELAAIESVPRVDRTGLYLALNAQQERVSALPLGQDIEEMVTDAQIEEAPTGGWKSQLSTFGNELKGLVTVRKHDEALEALISPEQESYLRQSLRLVLEQSQLALLKEEQELYNASLDKALTLIRGYYDTKDAGVQAVIESLEQLQSEEIHPELPDISGSQQALSRFIQQRFEAGSGGQGDNA